MSEQNPIVNTERKAVDVVRIALGVTGLVAIVLGAIILLNPTGTGLVMMGIIATIFAVLAVIVGLVYIGIAVFSKTLTGGRRLTRGLIGAAYLAAGIVIFANLTAVSTVLAAIFSVVVGISWIIEGVFTFGMLDAARSKAFSVVYAVLSIVAGGVLVFSPLLGATTLWLLLGISMLVMGIVQVVRAFTVKPAAANPGPTLIVG